MERETDSNPKDLQTKIITLKDNVKTSNSKLLGQISVLDEYYATASNKIWIDFESLVQSLKEQVDQLTSSLKLSTEAMKKKYKMRIEDNNLCENKLETLLLKLSELQLKSRANGKEGKSKNNCFVEEIELEVKSIDEKYLKSNPTENLNVVQVEYEPQFINIHKKIPSMVIGNVYLSKDGDCLLPSIEKSNNETKQALVGQHRPPKLVSQKELLVNEIDWISGITVTDHGHIFLSDRWDMAVKEYSSDGKLLKCYELPDEPWDIYYSVSSTTIFVMMAWDFKLALLEKSVDTDSFQVSKILDTDKRYVCVCLVDSQILATDRHTNIDILSPEGTLLRSLSIPALGEGMQWYPHRVSPSVSTNTFLLLNWDIQHLLCYTFEETLEFSHDLKLAGVNNDASAVGLDKKGRIYVCDKCRLYTVSPEGILNILLTFKKRLEEDPRIFICNRQDLLYLSCYENDNKYFKIFKID